MTMTVLNNLQNLNNRQGVNSNSHGIRSEKSSSENTVDSNKTDLANGSNNTQKLAVSATRDQITNEKTSNKTSIETAKSKLEEDCVGVNEIRDVVVKMHDIVQRWVSGLVSEKEGDYLNSQFNDLRKNMDTIAKKYFGDVDSKNENNINLSYTSRDSDGSSKESNINISFAATTAGLGLDSDSINFSNQQNSMESMMKIDSAFKSIDHSRMEIEHGMRQIDHDQQIDYDKRMNPLESLRGISNANRMRDIGISSETENYNILRQGSASQLAQASASQLAQANQAPAAVLKLL